MLREAPLNVAQTFDAVEKLRGLIRTELVLVALSAF